MGLAFAENKAKVVFTDIDEKKLDEVMRKLSDQNLDVVGFPCDVTKEEDLKTTIEQTVKKYGRLDILINNAGLQHVASIEEFPTVKFELMIKMMLVAPFVATKHVLPIMKKQNWGRIINIASSNSLIGFAGKAAYNSEKHGLIGLTKLTAMEMESYGITVNALCPGFVVRDFHPIGYTHARRT